jgi:hypothetical protein
MISFLQATVRRFNARLIWGASLLVPVRKRSEWLQEWHAELWYILRECFSKAHDDRRSIRETIAFSLGAYRDALWLQKRFRQARQVQTRSQPLSRFLGRASTCLFLLSAMFFLTWGIARTSPGVAAGMSKVQVHAFQPSNGRAAPCDCAADFTTGRGSRPSAQQFFDGFTHYKIAQQTVWAQAMPRTKWAIAYAGSDFFAVLQLPVHSIDRTAIRPGGLPAVVLSDDTWIRSFGGKPDIFGTRLRIGSVDAIVTGVTIDGSTALPGKADAWLLSPNSQASHAETQFVAAHLSPAGYVDGGRWTLSTGGILLALLTLLFLTRLGIGGYSQASRKPSLALRCRYWAFLIVKIALLLAIAYYASLDIAFLFLPASSQFSDLIQSGSAFTVCLVGLSLALRDQKQRCPVCLRRMSHPAEVGQPSRAFLAWNGTELACELGHTLVHIPAFPTSWFAAQRWVCLDRSWEFLFIRQGDPQA